MFCRTNITAVRATRMATIDPNRETTKVFMLSLTSLHALITGSSAYVVFMRLRRQSPEMLATRASTSTPSPGMTGIHHCCRK